MLKCRICGATDEKVIQIPYEPGRPLIAHEPCFITWAKRVLEIVEARERRMAAYNRGDRVEVIGIGLGTIISARCDDRGVPLFDIALDVHGITPTDTFVARACELRAA